MSITNDLSKLANSANVLVNSITVNSTAIVSEVIAGTLTTGNVTITGYVYANNGLLSNTSYTGPYTDGIVTDYVTGNGRISVGAADGITLYTNGVASNQMLLINATGTYVNGTVNSSSYTIGTTFTANASGLYHSVNTFNHGTLLYGNGSNVGVGTSTPVGKLSVSLDTGIFGSTNPFFSSIYSGTHHFRISMDGNWNTHLESIQASTNQSALAFDTNGAERMRISNTGYVGIGNSSPGYALDVSGTGRATSDFRAPVFYDTDNTSYYVDPTGTSVLTNLSKNGTTLEGYVNTYGHRRRVVFAGNQGVTNTTYELCRISRDSVNWSQQFLEINVYNTYYYGGVSKWHISYFMSDSGTVVCRESNGNQKIKVYLGSEVNVSGTIYYRPVLIDIPQYQSVEVEVMHGYSEVGTITTPSQLVWTGTYTTNNSVALYGGDTHLNTFGGNVGIGTSSPSGKLHVYSSGSPVSILQDVAGVLRTVTSGGVNYIQSGTAITNDSRAPLVFGSINGITEFMRIDSNGNLGVGASNVLGQIHIGNGTASNFGQRVLNMSPYGTGGGGASLILMGNSDSAGNTGPTFIQSANRNLLFGVGTSFTTGGSGVAPGGTLTEYMRIDSSGNLGIATSGPSFKLDVTGTGRATSDFRAPIFYDSDNTGYYVNPNGSTNIYDLYINNGLYLTNGQIYNNTKLNWYSVDGTSTSGQNRISTAIYRTGQCLYPDINFSSGTNSINMYDNNGSGQTTITRISAPSGTPSNSGYVLQVQHTGSGQTPGYGGFFFAASTRANATITCVFKAKLPSGYTLNFASNPTGTGGNGYWATDNVGTGKWEDYVYVVRCGDSGTFSSTHFYYISGSPTPTSGSPLTWYISSATVYDHDNSPKIQSPTQTIYTSGSGTYTVPTGVKWLRVRMVGGGGGGGGGGAPGQGNGTAGSNSTFGTSFLIAVGGGAGKASANPDAGGTATIGSGATGFGIQGGQGGYNTGVATATGPYGGANCFGGAGAAGSAGGGGGAGIPNTGAGGGGSGDGGSGGSSSGGSAGGFMDVIISAPLSSYSYSVGTGGSGGAAGSGGGTGGAGGSGIIIIEEHYNY